MINRMWGTNPFSCQAFSSYDQQKVSDRAFFSCKALISSHNQQRVSNSALFSARQSHPIPWSTASKQQCPFPYMAALSHCPTMTNREWVTPPIFLQGSHISSYDQQSVSGTTICFVLQHSFFISLTHSLWVTLPFLQQPEPHSLISLPTASEWSLVLHIFSLPDATIITRL